MYFSKNSGGVMKNKRIDNGKERVLLKSIVVSLVILIIPSIFSIIFGIYRVLTSNINSLDILTTASTLNGLNIISAISIILGFMVSIIIFNISKNNLKNELTIKKISFINIVLSIFIGIGICLINISSLTLISNLLSLNINTAYNYKVIFTNILSNIIIVPIAEELIFRSVIFNKLKTKYSIKSSIIIQGIIFGVIHLSINRIPYAIIMGIILGFIVQKTKSVYTGIIAHMIVNLISVFGSIINFQNFNFAILIILLLVGFIISITCYKLLNINDKN